MRTYVVEKEAVLHNIDYLLKKADKVPVWAVLKGNGYGLGLLPMAELCWQRGVRRFAVTELDDAQVLRETYPDAQILLMRPLMEQMQLCRLLELDVIATVSTPENAAALNGVASQMDLVAEVHVKIDTGMGRYGFVPAQLDRILDVYRYHDHLAVSGIYTHFHTAFGKSKITYRQADQFMAVVRAIEAAGIEPGIPHCCNSHAFLRFSDLHMGGVRLGSALLGRVRAKSGLRKVGICESRIEELRWFEPGQTAGYGAGWRAKKPTKVAVIPVGWYHGFACEHGNDLFRVRDCIRTILGAVKNMIFGKKIYVNIGGKKCPVLGHVGMLHTVCDVTKVNCSLGDKVTLEIGPTQVRGMEIQFR